MNWYAQGKPETCQFWQASSNLLAYQRNQKPLYSVRKRGCGVLCWWRQRREQAQNSLGGKESWRSLNKTTSGQRLSIYGLGSGFIVHLSGQGKLGTVVWLPALGMSMLKGLSGAVASQAVMFQSRKDWATLGQAPRVRGLRRGEGSYRTWPWTGSKIPLFALCCSLGVFPLLISQCLA